MIDSAGEDPSRLVVVVGAGPAGLTAAYDACRAGMKVAVLEQTGVVGGISQTASYRGYRFDIGGHRFFTKVREVEAMWREVLGDRFLRVRRLSRIHYKGRFFHYPLRPMNALVNLGVLTSLGCVASYLWTRVFPCRPENHFEAWVSNRFGRRLFRIFFKTYTEKVWGIPCAKIQAEWAAQRIKGLSLWKAIYDALFKPRRKETSLIEEFDYPEFGPGQMWEAVRDRVVALGGDVAMNAPVIEWRHDGTRVTSVLARVPGGVREVAGAQFLSSAPIRELAHALRPAAPQEVLDAADRLHYRDFLVVCLVIRAEKLFPDNWIYIHSPEVRVGRIQNFKNWSPKMVPDPSRTCLGMEYFCFEGDDLWTEKDERLVALATEELGRLGLADPALVEDGAVVRMPKAYPVYDEGYREALAAVRRYLERFGNLQLVGRNGLHRYNNQDHSMLTAMLAIRNLRGERHDLWEVNAEQEYHEEGRVQDRLVPKKVA
ncbi:MAG: NAD(P)/FAD-dependent oxidoreductase [Verrucomicrobiae bacterium]|nr:NAD(P)/FAD-dependent oxidoreductase [Verrucomicrobiae bacterium]